MAWSTIKLILTLSCEQSAQLVSESLDRDLPRGQRLAVRFHALCCRSCRRFARQLEFIRQTTSRLVDPSADTPAGPSLSPQARDRIRHALGNDTPEAG